MMVVEVGFLQRDEFFESCSVLFHNDVNWYVSPLMSPPSRTLRSSNEKQTKRYVKILHEMMEHHNLFSRMKELMSEPTPNHPLAEAIDRDMTRLMLAAKKKLKRPSPYPFSSKLLQACLTVTILKTHFNSIKRNETNVISLKPFIQK